MHQTLYNKKTAKQMKQTRYKKGIWRVIMWKVSQKPWKSCTQTSNPMWHVRFEIIQHHPINISPPTKDKVEMINKSGLIYAAFNVKIAIRYIVHCKFKSNLYIKLLFET